MDTQDIVLDGKPFRFVKQSHRGGVVVYTDGDLFARVGEPETVRRMISLHREFTAHGFPVPEIVGDGTVGDKMFFLEKSLGDKCFSYLFHDDIEHSGTVSRELFEQYISIVEIFARAQIKSVSSGTGELTITDLIRPEDLAEELPQYGEKILRLYNEAFDAVKALPLVLTHGDFCSHNLFPFGIIDFEKKYYAPIGYDVVTNIFQNDYFPKSREYEYYQLYILSDEQKRLYYERLDTLYRKAGFPEVSKYKRSFEYMRALWHTARNERAPKIQAWRYELFKKQYLL